MASLTKHFKVHGMPKWFVVGFFGVLVWVFWVFFLAKAVLEKKNIHCSQFVQMLRAEILKKLFI